MIYLFLFRAHVGKRSILCLRFPIYTKRTIMQFLKQFILALFEELHLFVPLRYTKKIIIFNATKWRNGVYYEYKKK